MFKQIFGCVRYELPGSPAIVVSCSPATRSANRTLPGTCEQNLRPRSNCKENPTTPFRYRACSAFEPCQTQRLPFWHRICYFDHPVPQARKSPADHNPCSLSNPIKPGHCLYGTAFVILIIQYLRRKSPADHNPGSRFDPLMHRIDALRFGR